MFGGLSKAADRLSYLVLTDSEIDGSGSVVLEPTHIGS